MGFSQSVSSVLGKFATFEGRAPRSEYWWWVLFTVLVNWVCSIIDALTFGEYSLWRYGDSDLFTPITSIVGLVLLIPTISVGVRRFHDMDRNGWWLLLAFTGIGTIIVFVWFMFRGTTGPNRFGPDPLGEYIAPFPPRE